MYCLRCGRANMEGRETCQDCGAKLGEEVTYAPAKKPLEATHKAKLGEEVTYAPAKEKASKRKHIGLLVASIVFVVLQSVALILSLFSGPTFESVILQAGLISMGVQGITQKGNLKKIKIGYFGVAVTLALGLGVLYKIDDEVISVYMFVDPVILLVMGLFAASAEKKANKIN